MILFKKYRLFCQNKTEEICRYHFVITPLQYSYNISLKIIDFIEMILFPFRKQKCIGHERDRRIEESFGTPFCDC